MTPIILSLIFVIVSLWLLWRKKKFGLFKRYNIPGPEPSIFFGNFWEIYREGQHNCISKWVKEYGRVFGYYYGILPILIVADLDMIRIIQQKDFPKFANRPILFEAASLSKPNDSAITRARGQKWKKIRSIITPIFTTAKLKMMLPIVRNSVEELYDAIEKKSADGKAFNIYSLYQNLTMDVIARSTLGFHTNCQTNQNEPFLRITRLLLSFNVNIVFVFSFAFTEFRYIIGILRTIIFNWLNEGINPRIELNDRTAAAIQLRRNEPNNQRKDLLQLLMDAQKNDEMADDSCLAAGEDEEIVANGVKKQGPVDKAVKMTDQEVLQNSIVFLIAGYETTSTALAFTTQFLTEHPDVQEKLREEIKQNITDNEDISYDICKLQYLESVIYESLRLQPPITYFIDREAVEDTVINGIRIPKGICIQIPVYYIHHDPTIWEDAEEFKPERFSSEEKSNRHPSAFQPFGAGPRNCIGMRFALLEIKMALAKLLLNFKFVKGNPEEKFEVVHSIAVDRPAKGVLVKVERL